MTINQQIRDSLGPRFNVSLILPAATVREIDALVANDDSRLGQGGRSEWIRAAIKERLAQTKARQPEAA